MSPVSFGPHDRLKYQSVGTTELLAEKCEDVLHTVSQYSSAEQLGQRVRRRNMLVAMSSLTKRRSRSVAKRATESD